MRAQMIYSMILLTANLLLIGCGDSGQYHSTIPATLGNSSQQASIEAESADEYAEKVMGEARSLTAQSIDDVTDDEIVERHLKILKNALDQISGSTEDTRPEGVTQDQVDAAIEKLTARIDELETSAAARQELADRVREFRKKLENGEIEPPQPDCEKIKADSEREDLPEGLAEKIKEIYERLCTN